MQRIEKAGTQSPDAPFTFVLSTEDVDRMGDVVVQAGISLVQFKKNPVALFGHSAARPIGTWENIRRDGAKLVADLKLAARGTSRMIDEVRALIEQRILRAASIGFAVIKSEPMDPDRPFDSQRYLKSELLEASIVAVPANPNALALRSLSPETLAVLKQHADTATAAPSNARRNSSMKKSIAERIKEGRERITAIDDEVKTLETAVEAGGELGDDTAEKIATLSSERESVEKDVANLVALEAVIAKRAEPAANAPNVARYPLARHTEKEPGGTLITRLALAHVFAHVQRRSLEDVVKAQFSHDPRVEAILKTAVGVADTTTVGWAKELVAVDVQGFLDALVPVSIYGPLAAKGTTINFGDAGSVTIPSRAGTNTDLAGAFVGENGVIPVKRTTFAGTTLNRYKMGVITAITKELSRASTPQAEGLLRRFMLEDTGIALDKALIDANPAVAGVRPAGLLNGIAAIPASAAATPIEKMIADLSALLNALAASGNGINPVFIVNPAQKLALSTVLQAGEFIFRDEVAGGRLMGVSLLSSLTVPAGDVILVDAAAFATGLGTPEFDASDTATLVMANADNVAPTQATLVGDRTAIGTAEQVPPDGGLAVRDPAQQAAGKVGEGSVAISMFQQWGIALRTVLPVSWAKLRAGSVQWVDNVTW